MTPLMRENLSLIIQNLKDAHAGLLIQRGLTKWEEGEKKEKANLINTISSIKASDVYNLAFSRWLRLTHQQTNFATLPARIDGRLYTGLALGGTLETGVSTQHAYGMPFIAGSSVKGAVRAYAETLFALKDTNGNFIEKNDTIKKNGQIKTIKRLQIDPDYQPVLEVLFGKESDDDTEQGEAEAGHLIWHDAWWVPPGNNAGGGSNRPFVGEVVTTHHQDYYNSKLDEPLEIESPIPNQQVAVQGEFYFVIEGVHAWAEYAKSLLEATLIHRGLGAKGASGYGYFSTSDRDLKVYQSQLAQLEDMQRMAEETAKKEKIKKELENATELHAELINEVNSNNWRDPTMQPQFTKIIDEWLDKLEAHPDEVGAIELFIELMNIHYEAQMKGKFNKKKPHQKAWVERLKALTR